MSQPPVPPKSPDPALITDRATWQEALRIVKGHRPHSELEAEANRLITRASRGQMDSVGWGQEQPTTLSKGSVTDWFSGRSLPSLTKLFTYLTVCDVPSGTFPGWQAALERVRPLSPPTEAPPVPDVDDIEVVPGPSDHAESPAPGVDSPTVGPSTPGVSRYRQLVMPGIITALVIAVIALVIIVIRLTASPPPAPGSELMPSLGPTATSALAPTTSVPNPSSVPTGQATIQVDYDLPGGCSTSYTVTGDVGVDPRVAGKTLWIVTQLAADPDNGSPNALYYPKTPVTVIDGRFTATIRANTTAGIRMGRIVLVASPDDAANEDLQLSLESDQAGDDRYPDGRRTRLQLRNTEIATTPYSEQRC